MLKTLITAMTVAGLLATAGGALAQPGPGSGWHHDSLFVSVVLSNAQQQKIADLRKASRQAERPLFEQMRAISERIDTALLSSGTVTEATLAPMVQQKAAIMQQLDAARLAEQVAQRNLLTDAQLSTASATHARLASLRDQERALHAGSMGAPPPSAD